MQPRATDIGGSAGHRQQDPRGSAAAARRRHPLLQAFPLAVMTLATFLVLFTLMMARLQAGVDPALRASASSALVAGRSGSAAVTTRTSGAVGASATPAATTAGSGVATPAVVTRTSRVPGASGGGDD
jgi:hypothetical protein